MCETIRGDRRAGRIVLFFETRPRQSKRNYEQFIIAAGHGRRCIRRGWNARQDERRGKGNAEQTAVVSQRERNYKCYPRNVNSTAIEIIPRSRSRAPRLALFITSHCSLILSAASRDSTNY